MVILFFLHGFMDFKQLIIEIFMYIQYEFEVAQSLEIWTLMIEVRGSSLSCAFLVTIKSV